MRTRGMGLVVASLCALAACQKAHDNAAMFPLASGHRWTYSVVTQLEEGAVGNETITLRTLGAESLPALDGASAWRRRSDAGVDYWLRSDTTGIYRVASKSDVDEAPQPDKPPRFVLKAPFTPGTQWQGATTSYLLMRRNDFPREIRYVHPDIPMGFQIEADDVAIDVPAGHFEHCLRVKGTATLRLYADPARGWRDMPITNTEWYCPGVGMVRLEREEPALGYGFLIGGKRTLELQDWQ